MLSRILRAALVMLCLSEMNSAKDGGTSATSSAAFKSADFIRVERQRVEQAFRNCRVVTHNGQQAYLIDLPNLTMEIPLPITEDRMFQLLDLRIDGKYLIPRAQARNTNSFACND